MAAEANMGIQSISLRSVDLQDLCSDELLLVAQYSGHFPAADFSNLVVPTINNSCFNASTGNLRPTYDAEGSSNIHVNRGARRSTSSADIRPTRSADITHWTQIGLISIRDLKAAARLTSNGKVIEEQVASIVSSKRVGPVGGMNIAKDEMELLSTKRSKPSVEAFSVSEHEGATRRRNPKRACTSGDFGEGRLSRVKRFHGKSRDADRQHDSHQRPGMTKNRLAERRMREQLVRMEGKWSCNSKTRKIVDVSGFPAGWTVSVGLRYENGRAFFEYRDWRSPDGTQLSSFKDATKLLLSSLRPHSTFENVVPLNPGQGSTNVDGSSTTLRESGNQTMNDTVSLRLRETLDETNAINLVQSVGGRASVDKTATEMEEASNKLTLESYDIQLLNSGSDHENGHDCRDDMEKMLDHSKDADLKELSHNSYLGSSSGQIDTTFNSQPGSKLQRSEMFNVVMGLLSGPSRELGLNVDHAAVSEDPKSRDMLKIVNEEVTKNTEHTKGIPDSFVCKTCGRVFSSQSQHWGHMSFHSRQENLKSKSTLKVVDAEGRQQLGKTESTSDSFGCKICDKVFSLQTQYWGHTSSHSRQGKLKSKSTLKVVNAEVRQHTEKTEVSGSFKCKTCGKVFSLQSQCWGHMGFHSRKGNLKSKNTLKVVNEEVRQHIENTEGTSDSFPCKTCGKVFSLQSQYWGHLSSHSQNRNLKSRSTM